MPDEHVSSVRFERAPASGEWVVSRDIEDEIVTNTTLGEVLLGVIDDLICPE